LIVFNKADLVEPEALESMLRQTSQHGNRECIAVSALDPKTLPAMLERAGALLARNLTFEEAKDTELYQKAHGVAQS
jgi:50S ribosomal subunit-associated GTPase HflX